MRGKKVFVAMSGGVDSSVSAALLKDAGYDVTGVFIRVWESPLLDCNWPTEREDARKVAAHLGIPFSTVDLSEEYKQGVVDYMIDEYKAGRTPNPDVMCNSQVKFGAFFKLAMERGADIIATGHYAQVVEENGQYKMLSGVDEGKDQTYFLWKLGQEELSKTFFPVGGYKKSKVRELARKFNLPVAEKKDSQGVCFLGQLDMREFLKHFIETKEGDVLDTSGKVIGKHEGALLYTKGQRRGFSVDAQSPNQEPLFIVDRDIEANTITVGPKKNEIEEHATQKVELEDVNWITDKPVEGNHRCRFRHLQELRGCEVVVEGEKAFVVFDEPQNAVSPGQSLVMYSTDDDQYCIGGGVISTVIS
jgi:tRNA-specific 2-thiouridylase